MQDFTFCPGILVYFRVLESVELLSNWQETGLQLGLQPTIIFISDSSVDYFLIFSITSLVFKVLENRRKCVSQFSRTQSDIFNCPKTKNTTTNNTTVT